MTHNAFLFPAAILDTPRLFTAIAEWLAIFVYFNIFRHRIGEKAYIIYCVVSAAALVLFQFVAGLLPLVFWLPMMMGAVGLMFFFLYRVIDLMLMDCGMITIQAFFIAEFSASVYRQLYVWIYNIIRRDSIWISTVLMILVYSVAYGIYYRMCKKISPKGNSMGIDAHELFSVFLIGVGAFIMSNISFVWTDTPISAQENLLYVRTLVDFGGMMMLMNHMGQRNGLAMKAENDAINRLFKNQYEQYKLAVDNSELLHKEMHDMKHYLAALKGEEDPAKREEVLADMEQAIAVQEAFMHTGNQVLDVILTTKSLQCQKRGITLQAVVDGELLSSIHVKDICSLFGNMLDNAIEATQQVEDREKSLINLSVRSHKQFLIIECENYSENKIEIEPTRALPNTTKRDKVRHGYGLKSIKRIAEKYNGTMTITVKDGWFKVKALLKV